MKFKIGISTYGLQAVYGDKGAIDIAKRLGVDTIDFFTNSFSVSNLMYSKSNFLYSKSDEEIVEYFADLRKYAEESGIEISQTHGRTRIFMNNPVYDEICLENARRDLLAAKALGASVCVMHGVKTPEMGVDASPELMHNLEYKTFSKILLWAKEYNVKVATETSGYFESFKAPDFFSNAKEFKDVFERISSAGDNSDYFTVCVDTGHTNTVTRFNNPSVGDLIRMLGKNISCLHLHDNNGISDQHLPMFAGTIDWNDVFDALFEIGYDGVYNLEVNVSRFGKGLEFEAADFAVKVLRHTLEKKFQQI